MANHTLRKHPMIDIIETHTPLPSATEEDISNTPIEISSDPLSSDIIGNQQGYWERVGHPVDDASNDVDKLDVAQTMTMTGSDGGDRGDVDIALAASLKEIYDKITINVNMNTGYSGTPVINFNIYTTEPRGKKRVCEEQDQGVRKKQMTKAVDKDLM